MKDFAAIGIDLPPRDSGVKVIPYLSKILPMIQARPLTSILVFMSAYDDDSRELYEIPEARASWVLAAHWLEEHISNSQRIDPESKSVFTICLAIERGQPVACDLENHSRLFVLDA